MSPFRRTLFAVALAAGAWAIATPAQAAGPFQYFAITPCRVFDTRVAGAQTTGAALANPGPYSYRIQGNCGVPNGAAAVSLNLTVVTPTRFGDIRLYPFAQVVQQTDPSTINYNGGETLANGAILPLSPVAVAGDKDMKLLIGMTAAGTVHLIVDVTGYFQ
jgi:hypothetical protein